jgi:hypothetical protein
MFTTTYNFVPADTLTRPKPVETPSTEQKEQPDSTVKPETRLWKLAGEVVKPKTARGELLILAVFLAVVVSAVAVSVQELNHLMRSDAIEHVAARALQMSE